ncbi:TlpA family protein disulfide reductase [Algoriphagus sediminis]|uniref:TlpA disulfide reductase family protein n=1 Tax=Algoriphagus sediminis TaxID=3057113 RepID=A0ABT7Y901_9BACT|nr:TlpA disulfide reductase family protein [Algoriphagus sediminis]MDN3202982.1 TlpA disulfide reductase family protein [Algoriphagus sediminis]
MKRIFICAILATIILCSCKKSPEQTLSDAKGKIESKESLNFKQIQSFKDPLGNMISRTHSFSFSKNPKSSIGYDFIKDSDFGTTVYLEGQYWEINPEEETVRIFSKKDLPQQDQYIEQVLWVFPVTFFKHEDWKYVGDTLVQDTALADFFRIENDKVVEGNTIYTEQHIFINPETSLVQSYERRNYFNGELSQTIWYRFEDYNLREQKGLLSYTLPENYKTAFFGQSKSQLLKVGQKAPLFSGVDLNNETWNLKDYRGKKVLLDFSVINCGYCLESLKYFNKEDFKLASNIEAVYINQEDGRNEVAQFKKKVGIPFPAIADAQEIARKYGVNSWPLFYLIDEEGVIEDVILGFDKEKIQALEAD